MLDVGLLKKVCNTVFLYHRRSRCEILIGEDDISNPGHHYPWRLLFKVYSIRARFRFALIGGNLAAHSTGRHRWIWGGIQIPETLLQALLPFPAPPLERPGELARRLSGLRSLQRLDWFRESLLFSTLTNARRVTSSLSETNLSQWLELDSKPATLRLQV